VDNHTTAKLVERIIATWPTGPKGFIWTDVLRDLHPGPAAAAYRQLRDTEQRITIAQYKAAYRALLGTHEQHHPPAGCNHCDGHGWKPIRIEHHGHIYDTTAPCDCPAGQAHTDTHSRIISANQQELNRIIPGRITRPEQEQLDANF
jgi:hypothetical protein